MTCIYLIPSCVTRTTPTRKSNVTYCSCSCRLTRPRVGNFASSVGYLEFLIIMQMLLATVTWLYLMSYRLRCCITIRTGSDLWLNLCRSVFMEDAFFCVVRSGRSYARIYVSRDDGTFLVLLCSSYPVRVCFTGFDWCSVFDAEGSAQWYGTCKRWRKVAWRRNTSSASAWTITRGTDSRRVLRVTGHWSKPNLVNSSTTPMTEKIKISLWRLEEKFGFTCQGQTSVTWVLETRRINSRMIFFVNELQI